MKQTNDTIKRVCDTGHGALGTFAGYQYQYYYFILRLLKMREKDETVGFEWYDDVGSSIGEGLTYYQLKHTINSDKNNLTICDKDLWKSIYVWIDIINNIAVR